MNIKCFKCQTTCYDPLSLKARSYQIKPLGFSVYYLEDLTFIEQIKLFVSSEFITGPHGAGLIWMLFSHKESIILEINSNNGKNHYKDIAVKMNLNYYRFIDLSVETNNNFIINISSYIHAVQRLILQL